jgi:hypothetical protein
MGLVVNEQKYQRKAVGLGRTANFWKFLSQTRLGSFCFPSCEHLLLLFFCAFTGGELTAAAVLTKKLPG